LLGFGWQSLLSLALIVSPREATGVPGLILGMDAAESQGSSMGETA